MKIYSPIFVCVVISLLAGAVLCQKNLDAKEIISRHLNSIAPEKNRQGLNTLFAVGLSEFESKIPLIKGGGKAIIASDSKNFYFLSSLNSRDYPYEKIGMFGNDVSLPFVSPGQRSFLGSFLIDNSKILSESLFGGAMSLRWITRMSDNEQLKLKSAGLKKVNGKDAYVIDVLLSGSDSGKFTARLYFDSATFHHVRSEYHREVDIGGITFRQQNQLQNASADLTEDFDDFKEVDGLTLPYRFKATLRTNDSNRVYETSLGVRVASYYPNQKLAPDFFTFEVK